MISSVYGKIKISMKIKYSIDERKKALIDKRAKCNSLLSQGALYWPNESLEFAHAVACLEIVLLLSDEANRIFNEIVKSWELPGCQALMKGFREECLPVTNTWKSQAIKAREKGEQIPEWPVAWVETYFKYAPVYFQGEPHNTDWEYFLSKLSELILTGFNRQSDQKNQTWKVIPGNSRWLISVIILRSQLEYCNFDLDKLHRYRPVRIDGKPYDLNVIMSEKPTAGPERKIYRMLINSYQKYDFALKHDEKLLSVAEKWYQVRVIYSGPEEFCRRYYNDKGIYYDPRNIINEIKICDYAIGYPRRS